MLPDRYGDDPLSRDPRERFRRGVPEVAADRDLVVECATSGFCGAVVGLERTESGDAVVLEDRHGRTRAFALLPAAFLLDGEPVTLVRPARSASGGTPGRSASGGTPGRSASGSTFVAGLRARTARSSRIWVEGSHDAELVEKVWGHDLRVEGVVVERLDGVDDLPARVDEFGPGPGRRLGVLVDHLVRGSKETRLAAEVERVHAPWVRVAGHPYVDVWAAVRPDAVGISAWPEVPRGVPWKAGVCAALGWPEDEAAAWRRILGSVRSYVDLEPAVLGRVEELIDFVTADSADR